MKNNGNIFSNTSYFEYQIEALKNEIAEMLCVFVNGIVIFELILRGICDRFKPIVKMFFYSEALQFVQI